MHPAAKIKKTPPPHFRFASMRIIVIAKRHTDGRTTPAAQFCDLVTGKLLDLPFIYGPSSKKHSGVSPYSQHFFADTPITLESSDSIIKHASGWSAVTAASGHPLRP